MFRDVSPPFSPLTSECSTHYLNDTIRFDVSSKDCDAGFIDRNVGSCCIVDVIRYLHWPHNEVCLYVQETRKIPNDIE
jgi:hypothetical protein